MVLDFAAQAGALARRLELKQALAKCFCGGLCQFYLGGMLRIVIGKGHLHPSVCCPGATLVRWLELRQFWVWESPWGYC